MTVKAGRDFAFGTIISGADIHTVDVSITYIYSSDMTFLVNREENLFL